MSFVTVPWLSMDVKCLPEVLTLSEDTISFYVDVYSGFAERVQGVGEQACGLERPLLQSLTEAGTVPSRQLVRTHKRGPIRST